MGRQRGERHTVWGPSGERWFGGPSGEGRVVGAMGERGEGWLGRVVGDMGSGPVVGRGCEELGVLGAWD